MPFPNKSDTIIWSAVTMFKTWKQNWQELSDSAKSTWRIGCWKYSPNKILAVTAESWLLKESCYELMIFDFVHIFLSKSTPAMHPSRRRTPISPSATFLLVGHFGLWDGFCYACSRATICLHNLRQKTSLSTDGRICIELSVASPVKILPPLQ